MKRVCAPPSSGETQRTSLIAKAVRTTLVLVTVVVLTGLPVTRGQNLTLQHELFPNPDDQHSEKTNASHRQGYEAKYFKCRCEGNQAWNGSDCVDTLTRVVVTNPDTGITQTSLTDDFAGVTVKNVVCPRDYVKMYFGLNSDPAHQFTLLPKGTLSWHQREYEHYCIDHVLNAEGVPITWEARVCVPPPAVPRCCLDAQDGSFPCGDDFTHDFSPPIKIDETFVNWPEVTTVAGRKCEQNEKKITLPLNTGKSHLFYESGAVSVAWTTSYFLKETQQEGFCVRGDERGGYVATICHEDQAAVHQNSCGNVTCVRKCCPEGQIHSEGTDCLPVKHESHLWKPNFVDADLRTSATPLDNLTILYGRPQCSLYLADPSENENDKFYLFENGDLFSPASNDRDPPTRYCVDNFVTADNTIVTKALICFAEVEMNAEPVCTNAKHTVYPALLLVSTVFLGITLFIYLSVPDLRGKLHGRCLISLASAFFVAFLLMSISYLTNTPMSPGICTTIAFFKHLSLLAAFFWLNVMCFDIWRTLRKTRTVTAGRQSLYRFLWYSLYAWGSALVIALVAVVLEQQPFNSGIIRPNFDNIFCWFAVGKSLWIYFYSWVSLVLLTNIVFFVLVMIILIKGHRNSMLRRSREVNRERMWLYVKLFLVMGVTWIAEVVSYQHGKCAEWMAIDIINTLEGFTLFLVFILNRSTLRKIRERWGCGASPNVRSPTTTFTSSFSTTSSFHSRKLGSIMSTHGDSKYLSNTSNSRATEMRARYPLNTLSEASNESPQAESTGYDSNTEDGETSRLNRGNEETPAI
ncbi:G-protein coupled receptor Mth2-like isoform X1 [Scylla paramamosain]|uniref:G-protein coupled receptor Mth2-like isoform X1 n=1 Tax=Scylla paramamosain TaxID=85552 RepID=UPI003082A613